MSDSFIDQARGLMFSPGAALERYGDRELSAGFIYYLKLLCVSVVLSVVVYLGLLLIGGFSDTQNTPFWCESLTTYVYIFTVVIGLIIEIVRVFVDSLFCHVGVYLMGGSAGFEKTALAVIYSSTPSILLGFIPGLIVVVLVAADSTLGIVVPLLLTAALWIWVMVLRVRGFMKYQGLSLLQAILVPVVVLVIAVIIFLLGMTVLMLPYMFMRF